MKFLINFFLIIFSFLISNKLIQLFILNLRDKFFSWGHGDHVRPKSIQEVYDRMDSLTEVVLKTKHIQGFCYTQLTDVEQETNGVYLYDRKTKFNMNKIKKIFKDKSLKLKKGYIQ